MNNNEENDAIVDILNGNNAFLVEFDVNTLLSVITSKFNTNGNVTVDWEISSKSTVVIKSTVYEHDTILN